MARYWFGGGIADWAFSAVTVSSTPNLAQVTGGSVITFWSAETGGSQYTDLLDSDGAPVMSIMSSDGTGVRAVGQVPPFQGPDNVVEMWASANGGPRSRMLATGYALPLAGGTMAGPLVLSGDPAGALDAATKRYVDEVSARVNAVAVNVLDYGATGDGATDDTAAIKAAIAKLQAANGGDLFFPSGTYFVSSTLIMWWNSRWRGAGVGATRLKLAAGANCDLIQTQGFADLTGGTVQGGPNHWQLSDMTLDGNGAAQTAGPSWPLRVYGCAYGVDRVRVTGGYSGGVWSEWGTGGTDMEAQWANFRIHDNFGPGLVWNGPHDSQFLNGEVFRQDGFAGITTQGNAGGDQFTNVHVWGYSSVSWDIGKNVIAYNCEGEGATGANLLIKANRTIWEGMIYGTSDAHSATEAGVQIGDATHEVSNYMVRLLMWQWTSPSHVPINFANDKGGLVDAVVDQGVANVLTSGTIHARSRVQITRADPGAGTEGVSTPLSIFLPSNRAIRVSDGFQDKFVVGSNITPGVVQLPNGTKFTGYTDAYTTPTLQLDAATGAIRAGTSAGLGAAIYSGAGAPPGTLGADGSWYLRTSDAIAGAALYQRRSGAWVAVDGKLTGSDDVFQMLGYLDNAIETAPRAFEGSYTAVSGRINLSYRIAYRTQTITQLGTCTRNSAVAGLTAARWGLYTVAGNGDLTLVARTGQNTTTAYTATFTEYTAPLDPAGGFPASYTMVRGQQYVLAQIVTFTTTAPVLRGYAGNAPAATLARAPRVSGLVGAQTDLLPSIPAGTVVADGNAVYLFGLA